MRSFSSRNPAATSWSPDFHPAGTDFAYIGSSPCGGAGGAAGAKGPAGGQTGAGHPGGMTLERDIEVLRRVPFFADIPAEPLKLLAFSADVRDLGDRGVLFSEGDRADGGFVVMAGRIDLVRDRDGSRETLYSVGPGTLIGEIALVIETDRPSGAVAVGRTKVVEIRRQTFRRVLEEYPEVVLSLHRRIADRLGELQPAIAEVTGLLSALDRR